MKRRSAKTAAAAQARRELVRRVLAARPDCEAGPLLAPHFPMLVCGGRSVDVHEVLTRGRGGDPLDAQNVRALCRACHRQVHAFPALSLSLGLLKSGVGRGRP